MSGCWFVFCFSSLFNFCPCHYWGQIWWPNSFENQKYMWPMGGLKHAFKVPGFFSLKFWVPRVGGGFFSFFLCSQHVPSSSQWVPHQVPNGFPMCTQRVVLIAPCFNPICFAQSPPLLTYIAAPKGTSYFNRIFYLGGASIFSTLFFRMGQSK
jgi:hypothetical protein